MGVVENEEEWRRPENWHGAFETYRAPRDSRVWVPKRSPMMGWTLNAAHPAAWRWRALLVGGGVGLALASLWHRYA